MILFFPFPSMGAPWMYCMALSTLTICFSVSVKDVTTPDRRLVTERAYEIARPTSPMRLAVMRAGYITPHTLVPACFSLVYFVVHLYQEAAVQWTFHFERSSFFDIFKPSITLLLELQAYCGSSIYSWLFRAVVVESAKPQKWVESWMKDGVKKGKKREGEEQWR